jgi:hypothetical protein
MTTKLIASAAVAALSFASTTHAANIRWMGVDMNTAAQSTVTPLQHVDTTQAGTGPSYSSPISSLVGTTGGAGANGMNLTGSATVGSGTSTAITAWNINGGTDTLGMTMNHAVTGTILLNNFAGSEGVFYFYVLTAGTLSVTYDYGFEETGPTGNPTKASDRGRSRSYIIRNSKGLGDGGTFGGTEIVNRDGSRTYTESVTPGDDLIAMAFDFRILDNPQETNIPTGYLNMTFTPIPEPSAAVLFGLAGLGLLSRRRRCA